MKICPKCGNENSNNSNYCLKCGTSLSGNAKKPVIRTSVLLVAGALGILLLIGGTALFTKTVNRTNTNDSSSYYATAQSNITEASADTTVKQNVPEETPDTSATKSEVDTITAQTVVGDHVYFGTYEQNNNSEDGDERIEWLVLDEEDGSYLLITSEVIDCVCYNNVWKETTWENCSLRDWLNSSFLAKAFTENQIGSITYSEHTDRDGNRATDRVFILNSEELRDYFESNELRTAAATPYAEAQGVYEYSNGNCWWWVSDAGADPHYARYVNCEGAILEYGMLVFNNSFGIRPAIWVNKN